MVNIRTTNDIVLALIDYFNTALPDADTKPGTVIRSLAIDSQASQLALLYDALSQISNLQSLRLVAATDLDRLAQNFGATRNQATKSSGVALFTFASIPAIISINKGDLLTASNGSTFSVLNGVSVNPASLNSYKALAIKFQNDLSFLGITDQYAIEVSVQATAPGSAGNIAKYSINSTAIPGVSNVTNVSPFTGGADQETDASFRNRVLAIFSGSNIGTALGYKNIALSNPAVQDALVVGPGNPLMTRDGTQVIANADGTFTITSEGTGGKVDVIILGTNVVDNTDSFIFIDKSNTGNAADPANNFVLGQIATDAGKTVTQKRIDDIANGTVPAQPVQDIISVIASSSGSNFIPMSIDSLGRVSGNYQLIKDSGVYKGSPFGFDTFAWVSNKISDFQDGRVKSKFNGQDTATYTDILNISKVNQNVSISNENSQVFSSDRSVIQLYHTPATNTTRVFNTNTGERYAVINQNLDGSGSTNLTGRIQISGNTLPAVNDILQVDYTWMVGFDPYSDYDGKFLNNNIRTSTDSVDWGMANAIRKERILFSLTSNNTLYTSTTKHPITAVINVSSFFSTAGIVSASTVPNFTDRNAIVLSALSNPINSIEFARWTNTNVELYNTSEQNGFILNNRIAVGTNIRYNATIVLPSDTLAKIGDSVRISYNSADVFNVVNSSGTFSGNQINIPFSNISDGHQIYCDVNYITSVSDVLSASITNLPISKSDNGFLLNDNVGPLNIIKSNTIKRENQVIQLNSSNQLFVQLGISPNDFLTDGYKIISVIDLASNLEVWSLDSPGTLVNTGSAFQLILNGHNSPKVGDNVDVFYFADDIRRTQPFTFTNRIIKKSFFPLQFNFTTNNFFVPISQFIVESGLTFNVIDTTTDIVLNSGTDGYISSVLDNGLSASFSSNSFSFASVDDLLGKKLRILNPNDVNNSGIYDIIGYNPTTNLLTLSVAIKNISNNQISVIRLSDNQDLWNAKTGSIDVVNNLINLPSNLTASAGSDVMVIVFTNNNLHQAPTRVSATVADQIANTGVLTISGTTIAEAQNIVFTAIFNGLKQNALEAIKNSLGASSNFQLPTNTYLSRIMKLEKVSTTTNNEILSVLATYDLVNTKLNDNTLYANEMTIDQLLSNIEFMLPSTDNNISNSPIIGDKLRITFYYATDNDTENLFFTNNGTLYTNKRFATIDKVYISSGFNSSQSAKFTLSYFTQPATGSRYTATYDYTAPKQNERISIQYNYNKAIGDTTFAIESQRPINADVLVRAATEVLVDATMNIVVSANFTPSIVLQNVKNQLTATINTNKLGDVLSQSNLINAAQSVSGVERARILYFNKDGQAGQVLTIQLQQDQYFAANNIVVNQEAITSG